MTEWECSMFGEAERYWSGGWRWVMYSSCMFC